MVSAFSVDGPNTLWFKALPFDVTKLALSSYVISLCLLFVISLATSCYLCLRRRGGLSITVWILILAVCAKGGKLLKCLAVFMLNRWSIPDSGNIGGADFVVLVISFLQKSALTNNFA